jgi:carboxymethylenebutenolidase
MGGRTALLAASAFKEILAAVIFYPTALYVKRTGGTTAFDNLGGITCPVIAFFGDTDRLIPPEHADRFEAALRGRGVPLEMHRYPDAGHAFCNFTSAADYREGPAADSWRHATAFLERHLRP